MPQPDSTTPDFTTPDFTTPGSVAPGSATEPTDPLFTTILGFLLPFFLTGAAGNPEAARAAIIQLINAYNASTTAELDLVGRVIGFSIAAMDNLRLSMTPGMSDTKILRYRSNAVTLSRASDQARNILEALQTNQKPRHQIPRPAVAAAPPPKPAQAAQSTPRAITIPPAIRPFPPMDIEAMKRDARVMMTEFSKGRAQTSTAIPAIANPADLVSAAVRAAMSGARTVSAA